VPGRSTPSRSGLIYGVLAYLCWGFFPLYWPLLEPATPWEVLAHRIVWSLVFCVVLLTVTRTWRAYAAIFTRPRQLGLLAAASVVITVNWGGFIWGVTHGHVVETSLGYFINPLVTVLLGVVVLGERLRRWQWTAVALGAFAVVVLSVDNGGPPWIALLLAFSFATYGFIKKRVNLGTIETLSVETTILTPFAVGYLVLLQLTGQLVFGHAGLANTLLLMGTGVVTAIPLLLFGAAATRLPLSTIGVLQYLVPILQFALGLTVFGEQMGAARWAGFALVWLALAIFTADALRHQRRVAVERRVAEAGAITPVS